MFINDTPRLSGAERSEAAAAPYDPIHQGCHAARGAPSPRPWDPLRFGPFPAQTRGSRATRLQARHWARPAQVQQEQREPPWARGRDRAYPQATAPGADTYPRLRTGVLEPVPDPWHRLDTRG